MIRLLALFSLSFPLLHRQYGRQFTHANVQEAHAKTEYDWYNFQAISSLLNIPLKHEEAKYIQSLLSPSHSTGTFVERGGRRVVALLCVQEGVEDHDLLANFLISATTNAPEFTRSGSILRGILSDHYTPYTSLPTLRLTLRSFNTFYITLMSLNLI